jgi:hypothetical protein
LLYGRIGVKRKLSGTFEFIGTTEDFTNEKSNFKPISFQVSLRNDLHLLPEKTFNDTTTIALFLRACLMKFTLKNQAQQLIINI